MVQTNGPGKQNITILSALSAEGDKASLIFFKGKNVGDQWMVSKGTNEIDFA